MLLGMWCSEITMVMLPESLGWQSKVCERHLKSLQAIKAPFTPCSERKKKEKKKPPKLFVGLCEARQNLGLGDFDLQKIWRAIVCRAKLA